MELSSMASVLSDPPVPHCPPRTLVPMHDLVTQGGSPLSPSLTAAEEMTRGMDAWRSR